jgi:hypothetical protein
LIKSNQRGHAIVFIENQWVYEDTLESAELERPCKRCNCMPTKEGYDACTGYVEGAKHACCGHGVQEPYVIY